MLSLEEEHDANLFSEDEEEDNYDTSREEEDEGFSEVEVDVDVDVEAGLNQYLLTLLPTSFNPSAYYPTSFYSSFNDKFNQLKNASLSKFHENRNRLTLPQLPPLTLTLPQFPQLPSAGGVTSNVMRELYNALIDEEYKENQKKAEFEKVRREFIKKLSKVDNRKSTKNNRKFLSTKIRHNSSQEESPLETECSSSDPLSDEFWSTAFFDTEDSEEISTLSKNSTKEERKMSATGNGGGDFISRPPLNPFYSRLNLSVWDYIKMVVLFPVVLVRILGMILFLSITVLLVYVGLMGLSFEETSKAPLAPWRRFIRYICAHIFMRAFFFFAGFQWVKTKGRQAPRSEAPVLVVAPHSSYFDAFAVTQCGGVSVFAKESTKSIPIFGKLIDFTQPIYVNREDASSRQGSVNRLRERVSSSEPFSQVVIFPEGTTTNRSALAQFKPGAFLPRVPVQPVVLRFPNRCDSVTWTWDSPSFYKSMYLTLSQFTTFVTIEFLDVYTPSPEEKADPQLYANNVQKVMADALGIPTTSFSLEDGYALQKLNETSLRLKLDRMWSVKGKLGLRSSTTDTTLLKEGISRPNFDWDFTLQRFTSTIFRLEGGAGATPVENVAKEILSLWSLFKEKETSTSIDLRPYCFLDFIMFASSQTSFENIVRLIFRAYAGQRETTVSREVFGKIMRNVFEEKDEESINDVFYGRGRRSDQTEAPKVISYQDFFDKIIRRVEYVRLFAMEATGQRCGNYPKRDERDHSTEKTMRRHVHFHSD